MNIGLTGGIASGKSTVTAMLADKGAAIVDADQIAREIVLPGSPVLSRIAQHFGQAVITAEGELNRSKLGEIIFGDEEKRKQLESVMHPPIRALMRERMEELGAKDPNRLVVVDVPLLFESKLEFMFQETVLVYIPGEMQLERLMKRNAYSREEAERRVYAQMPIEHKRTLADFVIDNSGTPEQTEEQVEAYLRRKGI